jgi:hypothetical protein
MARFNSIDNGVIVNGAAVGAAAGVAETSTEKKEPESQ